MLNALASGTRRLALLLSCLLAALVALIVSAPALAGTATPTTSLGKAGGLDYRTASTAEVDTPTTTPAACEPGEQVLGGGGSIGPRAEKSRLTSSYFASQNTSGDRWHAEGGSLGGSGKVLRAYAICDLVSNLYVQDSYTLPPGPPSVFEDAQCPAGMPTGGGVKTPGIDVLMRRLLPLTADRWLFLGENTGDADASITVYAVCNETLDLRYRVGDTVLIRPGQSGKATAQCRRGEAVTGGGFDSAGMWPASSRPWDSGDRRTVPDDGWLTQMHNPGGDGRKSLTPWAICKRL
jgi:hypothetical protein